VLTDCEHGEEVKRRTEQSKGVGIVLLDLPRSPAGCAASYKHEIVPHLVTNLLESTTPLVFHE